MFLIVQSLGITTTYGPLNKNLMPSVLVIDWITLIYCGALKTINQMDTRLLLSRLKLCPGPGRTKHKPS